MLPRRTLTKRLPTTTIRSDQFFVAASGDVFRQKHKRFLEMMRVYDSIPNIRQDTLTNIGVSDSSYHVSISGNLPPRQRGECHGGRNAVFARLGDAWFGVDSFRHPDGSGQFRLSRKRPHQRWRLHIFDTQSKLRFTFKFWMQPWWFTQPILNIIYQIATKENYQGAQPICEGDRELMVRGIVDKTVNAILARTDKPKMEPSRVTSTITPIPKPTTEMYCHAPTVAVKVESPPANTPVMYVKDDITLFSLDELISEVHRRYQENSKKTKTKPPSSEPQSAEEAA